VKTSNPTKGTPVMFCFSDFAALINNGINSKCLVLVLDWAYSMENSARNNIFNKPALSILFFCSFLSTSGKSGITAKKNVNYKAAFYGTFYLLFRIRFECSSKTTNNVGVYCGLIT
jgi:hypothetical protein